MTTKRYGQEITSEDGSDAVSFSIVVEVLNGQTFEAVGKKYGMKRQSAWERFNLTVVRRPFKSILHESVKNINDLRKIWNDFHRSNFDETE